MRRRHSAATWLQWTRGTPARKFVRRRHAISELQEQSRWNKAVSRRPSIVPSRLRKRSEEHTSELQSRENLVCRLLLEKKKGQGDAGGAQEAGARSACDGGAVRYNSPAACRPGEHARPRPA